MKNRLGLTMLEVLIALAILGVIATIFAQTSRNAQKITGKSENWDQEGIVIEKTIENLRVDYSLTRLRNLDSSWVDARGQFAISISVKGSTPTAEDCPGYPVTRLAKISLVARRTSTKDSIAATTFLLVP
jgi:prepilin-type N-terminal cleavage/methylation domain-containing protein